MQFLEISSREGVCSIILNRPDALNAFTPDLLTELVGAISTAQDDDQTRVIVLSGKGRAFSAGVDLKLLQGIKPVHGRIGNLFDDSAYAAAEIIRTSSIPVIAKVHGFCFTGALEIALHCDFIYTTVDTKFGDTHTKFGLRPTWGMSQNLARAVGVRRARELSYTARPFTGADAVKWGLAIDAVADTAALDVLVSERAAMIAGNSPGAVSAMKKLYRMHEQNHPLEKALAKELDKDFPEISDTDERLGVFGGVSV